MAKPNENGRGSKIGHRFGTTTKIRGVYPPHVGVGDLRVRVWLEAVGNLAISVLLGTKFMNRFMKGIFPPEGNILPFHSKPVRILASLNATVNAVTGPKANERTKCLIHYQLEFLDKGLVPMVEVPVLVKTSASGVMMIGAS